VTDVEHYTVTSNSEYAIGKIGRHGSAARLNSFSLFCEIGSVISRHGRLFQVQSQIDGISEQQR
jgi:hypothetical protein